ncbi:MAG: FapA family protein [Desulfobacteraceae bacterium]|jgi:hypothetical protein
MKYRIHIKSNSRKKAILEGAEKLGVDPSLVMVSEEEGENFIISHINSPGEFEIEARDDKMAAILRTITPSSGTGAHVTVEDIEKTLSEMGIIFGIDRDIIHTAVKEVNETVKTKKNVIIAKGSPPVKGEKARVELKTGRDAENKDTKASGIVKPGQVVAEKIPATSGKPGKDIFGENVPPVPGDDVDYLPGENVTIKDNHYISVAYGAARGTWQGISVTDYVRVSKDRMFVEMNLFPVLSDNNSLSFDDIENILKSKGIKCGIKTESIQATLEKKEPVENLRVAEAIPAKDGVDARIKFEFKVNGLDPEEADKKRLESTPDTLSTTRDIVLGGEILARKIPVVKQEDGRSVTGDVLKGARPNDRKIKAGDNVDIRDDGMVFVVSEDIIAGYPDYTRDTISVETPLSISEDNLSASLTLYPPCSKKRVLTPDHVKQMIARAGIKYGVKQDEIGKLLSPVEKKTSVVVVEGKVPVDGKDAVIDLKFDKDRHAGTVVKGTDRMDFKEQSFIHNVKKGDVLAEKIPLTMGIAGKDIFGETIPASPGRDIKLVPGANVLLSDDGLISDMDGMVVVSDGSKISVLKSHEFPGDIDMHTGNLTMDGSLVIRGWICAGFVVRASGEIHVGKGIEQAAVDAGAGLHIRGGILGADKADILSGGKLTAFFIENAKVHAKGDIIIRDDIRNSNVSTSSSIDATGGKGRVISGTLTAFRGITVNETGSAAGVRTNIVIGVDHETMRRMTKIAGNLEDFKRQKAKIDMYLVRFSNKKKLSGLPKSIRFRLEKLISQRRNIVQMETKLNKYRKKLLKKKMAGDFHPPSLTVNKIVYAGTMIRIRESVLDVKEDISGKVKFYLDENNQVIYR